MENPSLTQREDAGMRIQLHWWHGIACWLYHLEGREICSEFANLILGMEVMSVSLSAKGQIRARWLSSCFLSLSDPLAPFNQMIV